MKRFEGWEKYQVSEQRAKPQKLQGHKERMQALGRLPQGRMNKTEAAYARYLDARIAAGEVLRYDFERINIRLADRTFYKVDFLVLMADLRLEAHEVKGFWTDDARVKIKVAAECMPYIPFFAVKMDGGNWNLEKF